MLITYDDGDSEDFDLKWLKKGRALYHKYRHKDPLLKSKSKAKTKVSSTVATSKNAATTAVTTSKPRLATRRLYRDAAHYAEVQKEMEMEKRRKETEKRRKEKEMEEIRDALNGTSAEDQTNHGEATNARRVSDQSSNLNGTENKKPTNNNEDGNESDSSDEIEVVEVRVPYRPNPNLFILPDLAASTISNQINLNNLNNTNIANNYFGGINPYSSFPSYREGFYDF